MSARRNMQKLTNKFQFPVFRERAIIFLFYFFIWNIFSVLKHENVRERKQGEDLFENHFKN